MRFSLIDRITDLQRDESITAVKCLSLAEEYLQDHFPGFPVMPGVLMVESLVQAGAWLMRYSEDFAYSTVLLKEARAIKFNSFVAPGQTLQLRCVVQKKAADEYTLKGSGTVGETTVVSGRLTLQQFNLGDRTPTAAEGDERRIRELSRQFTSLWTPAAPAE